MEGVRGFTKDLTAVLGRGIFQFEPGGTYEEPECKTARSGFHFVEYAPDCLSYYPMRKGNRYFLIEAEDVDESQGKECCCHRITLKKELDAKGFAYQTMAYMINNPRMDWERKIHMCAVEKDYAEADCAGAIAIARGKKPIVQGKPGSILGLILEDADGVIAAAKLFEAKDGKQYTLDADRNLLEVAG